MPVRIRLDILSQNIRQLLAKEYLLFNLILKGFLAIEGD